MKKFIQFLFLLPAFVFSACEEVIELELDNAESQLAVDALVAVDDGAQKIRLTLTQPYFNNDTAKGVTGAEVKIVRKSDDSVFTFNPNPLISGEFISEGQLSGNPGDLFELQISYNGNQFTSISRLPRRQVIDSLRQAYRPSEFGNKEGIYLDLYSVDPPSGPAYPFPDFFWLRYSLDGVRNLRARNLLVGGDASFNPGVADGLPFIYPVRNSINSNKPYTPGQRIDVELLSIDAENYRFLKEMRVQLTNTGLFAQPSANVKGNIFNADANSKIPALGCFGICQISRAGITIQ